MVFPRGTRESETCVATQGPAFVIPPSYDRDGGADSDDIATRHVGPEG